MVPWVGWCMEWSGDRGMCWLVIFIKFKDWLSQSTKYENSSCDLRDLLGKFLCFYVFS